MATLPEMHVQPDVFLAEDVQFKPIPNHDVLWSIDLDDAVGTDGGAAYRSSITQAMSRLCVVLRYRGCIA
jgi:hypothetical protein